MGHARFLWVALFVMAAISEAHAAPPAGVVEGMARDALQRPLAGVHLRLEAPDARVVGNVSSGPDGAYRFTGVAPGVYSVVAEQEGFETATAVVSDDAGAGAGADLTLASKQALDLSVVAKRLEAARVDIQPRIGATTYIIPSQAIENQPGGGENNPLNQVVLQAPGVTQDSFGQIHVRNEHANVQYRINSVILPEGVSVFGQSLSPRIASSVDLITGALPAEYGLRTAGIIDIQTKSGAFTPGGSVGIYGGSHGWLEPSAEYGGSIGTFNYFVAGDYLQNGAGIEPPTRTYHPIHDATEQGHGFAYLEDILDATSKVSAIFGTYRGQFQIPDIPGQTSNFHANGISAFDSAQLDENQREINHYGVLSYLKSTQDIDFQISGFTRYSSLSFRSDALGDLLFSGIAESAYRRSFASGLQAEAAYRIASDHTLRSGVIVTGERTTLETTSLVLPAVGGVQVPPDTPFPVVDNGAKTGWTYSLYLQDEWRLTPAITLNYGGRFNVVDAFTRENQLSPRVNAVWKATPSTTVHAGYANYFTPPPPAAEPPVALEPPPPPPLLHPTLPPLPTLDPDPAPAPAVKPARPPPQPAPHVHSGPRPQPRRRWPRRRPPPPQLPRRPSPAPRPTAPTWAPVRSISPCRRFPRSCAAAPSTWWRWRASTSPPMARRRSS